jgi:trehalose 6-phosphate synthase/phosphatase
MFQQSDGHDGRVIIVSNRLPVVVRGDGDNLALLPAAGGLATGLRPLHETGDSIWIGWAGDLPTMPRATRKRVVRELQDRRIQPVELTRSQSHGYYNGVCNGVLWPLFHYQIDRIPLTVPEWEVYRSVNERFADAVVREYRDGDAIWIHDYHLLLVPGLVRDRLPDARIGFFLHIPFPACEIFRVAPWRREILAGMLGATVVGFHTPGYASQFEDAVRALTAFEVEPGRVTANARSVRVGAYPMGVDAAWFTAAAATEAVRMEREQLAGTSQQQLLLGIDRLDYTKGIPRRLLAYEQLLRDNPEIRGRVRLIQVAVPSRDTVPSYQKFRREIDEIVGRINGEHGTVDWTPIRYLHQSVSPTQLVALYGAADVMLVTPLCDGMNLVAKEFIASRADGDGVLLLSEFAGAAAQLPEAVSVNPYAIDEMAAAIKAALTMDVAERRRRMRALRARVAAEDITWWAASFMRDLRAERLDGRAADPAGESAAHRVALADVIADLEIPPVGIEHVKALEVLTDHVRRRVEAAAFQLRLD